MQKVLLIKSERSQSSESTESTKVSSSQLLFLSHTQHTTHNTQHNSTPHSRLSRPPRSEPKQPDRSHNRLRYPLRHRRHHPSSWKCHSRAISSLAGCLISPLIGQICEASAQLEDIHRYAHQRFLEMRYFSLQQSISPRTGRLECGRCAWLVVSGSTLGHRSVKRWRRINYMLALGRDKACISLSTHIAQYLRIATSFIRLSIFYQALVTLKLVLYTI